MEHMREFVVVHVTALLEAFVGETVATNVCVPPFEILRVDLFNVTPVTATVTLTVIVARLLPSCVVTVIVALPVATAVIRPEELTVATPFAEEVHDTVLLLAVVGATVATA
jgi:hypothetical protein